jgi:hypothetical protein
MSLATSFHNGCHAGHDQAHDHDDEAREPPDDETGIGQKVGGHPKSQGEDQANKGNIQSLTWRHGSLPFADFDYPTIQRTSVTANQNVPFSASAIQAGFVGWPALLTPISPQTAPAKAQAQAIQ